VYTRRGLGDLVAPGHDVGIGLDRRAELIARESTHDEQRRLDAELAQIHRLGRCRHGEPLGTAPKRCLCNGTRTVAIRVGLHHRAQRLRKPSAIALDSPQIHPRNRSAHPAPTVFDCGRDTTKIERLAVEIIV
jgi:hypothetical protein